MFAETVWTNRPLGSLIEKLFIENIVPQGSEEAMAPEGGFEMRLELIDRNPRCHCRSS
jgi:hypothetical protein